jgi:hypothetical protein
MKLIEYSVQWAKGEMFEGMCIAILGVVTLLCTFLVHRYGTTVNARALLLPSFIFALLFMVLGSYMMYSNNHRISTFQTAYEADPQEFILNEKKRVEDFQVMYPASLAISAVCFIVTLLAFAFSESATFHATGLALSAFGLSLIIIDYFSKERAHIYYEYILNHL